ncbi:glycogen debranching N-terminal domain-containing protein [Aestuariimicrobium ganziense]|uniref:glycogen debranching N-terminal domain-containing protein n=1 Tax=Aestuariimicrobium ganziense TaxID=2773677 RepID=UPI0019441E71|nr:glycogen debranching N-terminal domain-containing protein [Aestuariimicrobium ganziense]
MYQPFLHDLEVELHAPLQAWSDASGQTVPADITVAGLYCADQRVVSSLELSVTDRVVESMGAHRYGGDAVEHYYGVRTTEFGVAPAVTVQRSRRVDGEAIREKLLVTSAGLVDLPLELVMRLTRDDTEMEQVKSGRGHEVRLSAPDVTDDGVSWSWRDQKTRATVSAPGAEVVVDGLDIALRWQVVVPARGTVGVEWSLAMSDTGTPFGAHSLGPIVHEPSDDLPASVQRLVRRSVADLNGLRMADLADPAQNFFAAGAPWYFTLFGRDSIISATLARPWSSEPALGTLRALAARQGATTDPDTAEAPGKILHEVRRAPLTLHDTAEDAGERAEVTLPPLYYGTIDATCLWMMLLADLVRDGQADLAEFLPALRGTLGWLRDHSDPDGDGFVEYHDVNAKGLANQGWKDSGDSIRWADGRQADAPIALAEVQGYAHAAAVGAAELLRSIGEDEEAAEWEAWAAALKERFRAQFWVEDDLGRYPALALDAAKQPVDGVASNMGHLLGTGILDDDEQRIVVDRLMHPTMFSGYGIRTLSTTNGGYWPIGYHVGSVWTHDTAWIVAGMLREGFTDQARTVAEGLVRAAEGYDHRLPELFSGQPADEVFPPLPYPASCKPQAWAAASAAVVEQALR